MYRTLKGFIKWIYVPLVTNSTIALLKVINLTTTTIDLTTILAPAIVLGFLALLPFIQLIVLKCIQKENTNIWIKWLEFFGYLRLLATSIRFCMFGREILSILSWRESSSFWGKLPSCHYTTSSNTKMITISIPTTLTCSYLEQYSCWIPFYTLWEL